MFFFLLQKSTARSGVPLIGRVALYIRNVLPCRRGAADAASRACQSDVRPGEFARLRMQARACALAHAPCAVYTCARANNIGASLTGFRDKKDRCALG